jgi:hypothetical protein
LFDKSKGKNNSYARLDNGVITSTTSYFRSDYILIKSNAIYTQSYLSGSLSVGVAFYDKNKTLPNEHTPNAAQKAWWICKDCGYEWKTRILQMVEQIKGDM